MKTIKILKSKQVQTQKEVDAACRKTCNCGSLLEACKKTCNCGNLLEACKKTCNCGSILEV